MRMMAATRAERRAAAARHQESIAEMEEKYKELVGSKPTLRLGSSGDGHAGPQQYGVDEDAAGRNRAKDAWRSQAPERESVRRATLDQKSALSDPEVVTLTFAPRAAAGRGLLGFGMRITREGTVQGFPSGDSAARDAGVAVGWKIVSVNDTPTSDKKAIKKAITKGGTGVSEASEGLRGLPRDVTLDTVDL